mgnify:CR=1 FL=1
MAKIKILLMLLVVLVLSNPLLSSAEVKKGFYPDGKLKSELNYKNGNVISKKDYDEFGKLIN